ncbi:hypothetical protein LEN26_011922 [Aphanomyces euteiches]|nr:hypothetical protein AeMF1_018526 [Aphanomyces euteiches]KAH9118812.1 hypothetical protein LEN26_011922 [Aphanomyces euteiches]
MNGRRSGTDDESRLPILEKYTQDSSDADARSTNLKVYVIGVLAVVVIVGLAVFGANVAKDDSPPLIVRDFTGDLRKNCTQLYMTQRLNQFGAANGTYEQRYFVCDDEWTPGGPIFFYTGNEANVELYLNHTGLMWENAAELHAMLIFAEHRFFGLSMPTNALNHMEYLSTEQALADFAVLLRFIKESYAAHDSAVIAFGGSYGGMLATYFRLKYPHIVDGAIAGSAPVLAFDGQIPAADMGSFPRIVTRDASPAAGADANCIPNMKALWPKLKAAAKTIAGRAALQEGFGVCKPFETEDAALGLVDWIVGAFASMAMGNFPYPSSYLLNGASELPPYPVRAACSYLKEDLTTGADDVALYKAVRASIGIFYNATLDVPCFTLRQPSNESQHDQRFWDYLACTEMYMPMDQTGDDDFYPRELHNQTAMNESCMKEWGVELRPYWANTVYGGRQALEATSNIVFTNGNLDPWSGVGVLESISPSVVALIVDGGAHHLDLMFSHPLDPPSVQDVRNEQKKHMRRWISSKKTKKIIST